MDIFDKGIVMSFSMIMQKGEIPSSHSADFYYSGITQMQFGEMNWRRLKWIFGENWVINVVTRGKDMFHASNTYACWGEENTNRAWKNGMEGCMVSLSSLTMLKTSSCANFKKLFECSMSFTTFLISFKFYKKSLEQRGIYLSQCWYLYVSVSWMDTVHHISLKTLVISMALKSNF